MRVFTRHIGAVARNTFRESIRDRILLSVVVFAMFLIGFSLFMGSISLGEDEKIITDVGLAAIFLLQIFVAIFVGASLFYKEIEGRTFFLILPKPLQRWEIILGKVVGLGLANGLLMLLSSAVFFTVLYFETRSVSAIPLLFLAVLFGYVEVLLVTLLSIFFSSFASPILAALYTSAVFLIGHSSSLLREIIEKQGFVMKYILSAFYYLFPSFEKLNIRNDVAYGVVPSFEALLLSLLYAIVYAGFLFLLSLFFFEKRQF